MWKQDEAGPQTSGTEKGAIAMPCDEDQLTTDDPNGSCCQNASAEAEPQHRCCASQRAAEDEETQATGVR